MHASFSNVTSGRYWGNFSGPRIPIELLSTLDAGREGVEARVGGAQGVEVGAGAVGAQLGVGGAVGGVH